MPKARNTQVYTFGFLLLWAWLLKKRATGHYTSWRDGCSLHFGIPETIARVWVAKKEYTKSCCDSDLIFTIWPYYPKILHRNRFVSDSSTKSFSTPSLLASFPPLGFSTAGGEEETNGKEGSQRGGKHVRV